MTRHEAVNCLTDKINCQYCKCADGNCRQEAIDIAVRSLKAWEKVIEEVDATDDGVNPMYTRDVIAIINKHMNGPMSRFKSN